MNLAAGVGKEGKTPLHLAAEKGHASLAEKLLSYDACDVDARTTKIQTPLHLAVLQGKRDIVNLLLDYGADVNAEVRVCPLRACVRATSKDGGWLGRGNAIAL